MSREESETKNRAADHDIDTAERHLGVNSERPEQDVQWSRILEVELVPHPDQPHPDITAMDYGMQDGLLRLRLRGATAGYVLRKWSVDCSPDHRLRDPDTAFG